MTYYDPLAPSLEAIRFDIERSTSALAEKLRKRRELDLDIDYLRNEELERRFELAHYHHGISNMVSYTALTPGSLYAPLAIDNPYVHDRYLAERSRYAMEEDEKNINHLQRMRDLQLEQQQLSKEKLRSTVAFFGAPRPHELHPEAPYSFHRTKQYISYEDDAALIRKYQDGTRAQEIRDQLDSYSNPRSGAKGPNEFHRQPVSRPLAAQFKQENHQSGRGKYSSDHKNALNLRPIPTAEERSPYSKLNYETTDKKGQPNLNIFKNEGIRSPSKQKKQEEEVNQEELDDHTFYPSNKKRSRAKSFKQFEVSRENWTNSSIINKAYKPKSGRKSAQKSPLKMSTIERSRTGNLSFEEAANLKIKNRLKVSQIIFEDSKFRNVKHETSHLHMTFQNQLKIRKQIRDKINSHPIVLKKHAMVVEG